MMPSGEYIGGSNNQGIAKPKNPILGYINLVNAGAGWAGAFMLHAMLAEVAEALSLIN